MKRIAIALAAVVAAFPVAAQQARPSPSQTAIAIGQAVNGMAIELDGAQRQIVTLQRQTADDARRISELTAKCGAPCAAAKQPAPVPPGPSGVDK